jgi:hypothetical protein
MPLSLCPRAPVLANASAAAMPISWHFWRPGVPSRATMQALLATLRGTGNDTAAALRTVRQLVLERLVLDCDANASLVSVTGAMTELAEIALDAACTESTQTLDLQHGAPQTPHGTRAQICIIGMGKLGARELNVSSDIDLIYVYDQDGEPPATPVAAAAFPTRSTLARWCAPSSPWWATPPNTVLCSGSIWRCAPMATPAHPPCRWVRWRNTFTSRGASGNVLPGSRAGWSPRQAVAGIRICPEFAQRGGALRVSPLPGLQRI